MESDNEEKCDRKPDSKTVVPAQGTPDIVDVHCKKCGACGSFVLEDVEVQWD